MFIADFKKLVSDYMNRDSVIFDAGTSGQVDKLLLAANNAKKFAQRRMLFERARCTVDIVVDKTSGGDLTTAVLHDDGVTPIDVQTLERAYVPASDGSGLVPIDLVDRNSQFASVRRRSESVRNPTNSRIGGSCLPIRAVRFGDKVFFQNWDTKLYTTQTITGSFDVVRWMPDYADGAVTGATTGESIGGLFDAGVDFVELGVRVYDIATNTDTNESAIVTAVTANTLTLSADIFQSLGGEGYSISLGVQEDFFLTDCVDWMLYRTIQELNLFLKEDQRVVISAKMMDESWETVKSWNTRLEKNNDDYDLE